ncbi:MAG: PIN domain nuclease [Gammaproteobacteria bacterium]|nr:PIN domain nuclease [Gammaproteobacteria bacterium]
MILVDSSVWISFLNGVNSAEAAFLAVCIAEDRSLIIPGLVRTEVLLGARTETDARRMSQSLSAYPLVPEPTPSDYERAAAIYRTCRGRGYTIRSAIDCLIAQLCLRDGHELLAKDRDFDAIGNAFPLRRVPARLMIHDPGARYAAKAAAAVSSEA